MACLPICTLRWAGFPVVCQKPRLRPTEKELFAMPSHSELTGLIWNVADHLPYAPDAEAEKIQAELRA